MTFVQHIRAVPGQCPVCQHAPIQHQQDGVGHACRVCLFMLGHDIREKGFSRRSICHLQFLFRLSPWEREQAMAAYKASFPPRSTCAVCYCSWEAHWGMLCPTGDSTFELLLESKLPFLITK
jgi:hypothetical protein